MPKVDRKGYLPQRSLRKKVADSALPVKISEVKLTLQGDSGVKILQLI